MTGGRLAIDIGTNLGWAYRGADGRITHGFISLKPNRFEGGGMRSLRARRWLHEIAASVSITEIVFEEVRRHQGVDAAHVYGAIMGEITAFGEERSIPYRGIPIGIWKKALTGKGNASKDQVMAAVMALGYCINVQDEADVIGILRGADHC